MFGVEFDRISVSISALHVKINAVSVPVSVPPKTDKSGFGRPPFWCIYILYDFLCLSFVLVVDNRLDELIVFIKHLSHVYNSSVTITANH